MVVVAEIVGVVLAVEACEIGVSHVCDGVVVEASGCGDH